MKIISKLVHYFLSIEKKTTMLLASCGWGLLPIMDLEGILNNVYDHFESILFFNRSVHYKHYYSSSHSSIEFDDLIGIFDLSFDATSYDPHKLSNLMNFILSSVGQIEHFESSKLIDTLNVFYCDIPYHNYVHACDVTQACFLMLNCYEIKYRFTELDRLSLLIAALGHDAGHNGIINDTLRKNFSSLSLLYNDQSPLENLHCFTTLSCLNKSNQKFLQSHITAEQKLRMRTIITESILSTDMAKHQYYFDRISSVKSLKNDNILLGIALIKASDICNVFREFDCSKKWANKLFKERELDKKDLSVSQVSFLESIGMPFFKVISDSFHGFELFSRLVLLNLEYWSKEIN